LSEQQPPADTPEYLGAPEYLDSGSGSPLAPEPPGAESPTGRRSRRTTWLVGGGVVGLLALGAGAWAALSFFSQGAQPAEALPSTTVAYASIDLDPSGSQKIDAFRTLNKFPAFKDKVGIHSVDDVRQKLGDELIKGLGCDGLTFADDIDPWLGNRAAVAAVDLGKADPETVSVVQVTDDGKARSALQQLVSCGGDGPADISYDVHDGWAIFAGSQNAVDKVVSETEHASLADDATYQKWTNEVGDSGVVNLYAAPAAGEYLAGRLDGLQQDLGDLGAAGGSFMSSATNAAYTSTPTAGGGAFGDALKNFAGAAATIRFTGDGLELATATDPALTKGGVAIDQGGTLVENLPDDTAAAIGVGLAPGWLDRYVDQMSQAFGGGKNGQQLLDQLSRGSGLNLPDDIETLLGSSTALSISKDFDFEAASMSGDGEGVPVAVTVRGDENAIEKVLDKLRAKVPGGTTVLGSDSGHGLVVVGPSAAYRQEVLTGGDLGDSDAFRGVVPDAGDASVVVYVNVDDLQKMVGQLSGGDHQIVDNIAPLKAFGFSGWIDGDVARTSLKISTD
jgi:Protein of unknown function (DUF3352)